MEARRGLRISPQAAPQLRIFHLQSPGDIKLFIYIFGIVTLGASVASAAFQKAALYDNSLDGTDSNPEMDPWDPFEPKGGFWSPLWLMFGVVPFQNYKSMYEVLPISASVGWLYSFFSTVVMVNLLVAQFADTCASGRPARSSPHPSKAPCSRFLAGTRVSRTHPKSSSTIWSAAGCFSTAMWCSASPRH